MYKLFLTIRYLTRKKIVVFPILVVWLCLMMMIIVTSIMGGFVDRVRQANRDFWSDVVISDNTAVGWPYYEQLQATLKKSFPDQIESSTPIVQGYGLMNVPRYGQTWPAQVTGIYPDGRAAVSKFRQSLFRQYDSPMQTAADLSAYLPATSEQLRKDAEKHWQTTQHQQEAAENALRQVEEHGAHSYPAWWWLVGYPVVGGLVFWRLRRRRTLWTWVGGVALGVIGASVVTVGLCWPVIFPRNFELTEDAALTANNNVERAMRTELQAQSLPAGRTWHTLAELQNDLVPKTLSFAIPGQPAASTAADDEDNAGPQGCIVGVQFPLYPRDKHGNFDRHFAGGNLKVILTVVPIAGHGTAEFARANTDQFTVVDDSYTGVYDIDSTYVYAPFDTVQLMAGMRSEAQPGSPEWFPKRCNEVLVKLKGNLDSNQLKLMREKIGKAVEAFQQLHPDMPMPLSVQTWDEKQAKYLGAVENEKRMMTFILGLMSCVVLIVIFLIFYMIVRDKTRDIGIIKAIGGTEEGVAGIFLIYGLFIGLVGGVLGLICGVQFVYHTNQIHEWIYHVTGIMIWDRSVYLFDKIPDQIHPGEVAIYFVLAVLAGVIGALLPALVAGSEDPVQAVRHE